MQKTQGVSLSDAIANLSSRPWIIAHRGDWSSLPENSIEAMYSAIDNGADMVEIDAQSAGDGTLVVIHDDNLDRTTNVTGPVNELTAAEIESIVLKSGGGGSEAMLTDCQMPTLAQFLEAARGRALINIDTKHKSDLNTVADLVLKMGMEDQVLLKMSLDPITKGAEFLNLPWFNQVHFMPIILDAKPGELVERVMAATRLLDSKIVEIQFQDCDELLDLSRQDVHIWVNTLDLFHPLNYSDSNALASPEATWGDLLRLGVGAIQTDYCSELAGFLGR